MILGSSSPGQKARTRVSAAQLDLLSLRPSSEIALAGKFAGTRAGQRQTRFERLSQKWAEARNREIQSGSGQLRLPISSRVLPHRPGVPESIVRRKDHVKCVTVFVWTSSRRKGGVR